MHEVNMTLKTLRKRIREGANKLFPRVLMRKRREIGTEERIRFADGHANADPVARGRERRSLQSIGL